MNYKFSNT